MRKLIWILFTCTSLMLIAACSSDHGHDHDERDSHNQKKQHDTIN